MKRKDGYLARKIGDTFLIVPVGARVIDFKGMFTINELGMFIWELLEKEVTFEGIVTAILGEYDTDKETASSDLTAFLDQARSYGVLQP